MRLQAPSGQEPTPQQYILLKDAREAPEELEGRGGAVLPGIASPAFDSLHSPIPSFIYLF